MPLECVTFDLDDTLWECESVLSGAEHAFYAWIDRHYPRITASYDHDSLTAHRREFSERWPEIRHDLTHMRKHWLAHLAREFGYGEELVDEGFRVFWEKRNAVTLFDDVPGVLGRLKERYAIGAITNGNADVHYIGIGHYFDFVVTAASAGAAKPMPEIFRVALDAARVSAERAVHVGDDPERDVRGAAAVGMRTVWVNVDGSPWEGEGRPDAEIRTLEELVGVLPQLE